MVLELVHAPEHAELAAQLRAKVEAYWPLLTARTRAAISDLNIPDTHTLIVTHAGVIKAAFAALGGDHHYRSTVSYGGHVTLLEHRPRSAPS